jgi:hypothetical protein
MGLRFYDASAVLFWGAKDVYVELILALYPGPVLRV